MGAIWRYASTVFTHWLMTPKNIKIIRNSHGKALISCTRAYCTTGYLPLTVIAGWPPLEYEILKRNIKYAYSRGREVDTYPLYIDEIFDDENRDICEIIKEVNLKIREKWEILWEEYRPDSTTKILFPTISDALKAPVYANFFLTQALSGHGCQREY